MKKNLIAAFFAALTLAFCTFLTSCESDISLEVKTKADGSTALALNFSAICGDALKEMLLAAAGSGTDASTGLELFDCAEISSQLKNAGFSSIQVNAQGVRLQISMEDSECKSYLFTSGLLEQSAGNLKINLSAAKLKAFYDSCDEELQMLLDLFMAPVFNDEAMQISEYEELIAAVYGSAVQKEINTSKVRISIKNPDGTITKKTLSLSALLCGVEADL